MNSLAIKSENGIGASTPEVSGESHPCLCLRGGQVKAFTGGFKLEPDKVYEVTIQFKMEGWRDSASGKSLDLCVLSSGEIEEVGEVESDKPSTASTTATEGEDD
jgi:hypothetical protein